MERSGRDKPRGTGLKAAVQIVLLCPSGSMNPAVPLGVVRPSVPTKPMSVTASQVDVHLDPVDYDIPRGSPAVKHSAASVTLLQRNNALFFSSFFW